MAFNDFRDAARLKTDFYGTKGGPAIPAGRGLRRIGPTPPRFYPLEAYQPPAIAAPGGAVNVMPPGTVAPQLPGSAPPPALRAPGGMTGVSERGFTMNGGAYTDTINTTARPYTAPTPSAPQGRIAYNPVRVKGPGIEGMGDFAPEGASRAKVAGRFGFKSLARGVGRALRVATGPVPMAVTGLSTVAGMHADATANSNGPVIGLRRGTPLFGAPGPGRSITTNVISNTDPFTGEPVSVTQSVDQGVSLPVRPPPATDNPAYYNQGRGGSAADALKEVAAPGILRLRPKKSAVAPIGASPTSPITPDETLEFNRMMVARGAVPQDITGYIDSGKDYVVGFNRDNQTRVLTRGEADTFDAAYPSRPDAQAVNNVEIIKGGVRGYGNRMTVEPRQIGKPISTADQAADMFNELRSSIDPRTRRPMSLKDASEAMQNIGVSLYQTPVAEKLGVEKNRIDAAELPIKQKQADALMRSAGASEISATTGASLLKESKKAENIKNTPAAMGEAVYANALKDFDIFVEKSSKMYDTPEEYQRAREDYASKRRRELQVVMRKEEAAKEAKKR